MLLLTDGTVMAQTAGNGTNTWFKLTPDSHGSYVNGTWSALASMHDTRLYFSSDVLRDGRVFVAGAEDGTGGSTAEVYDPLTNTWTLELPPLVNPSAPEGVQVAFLQGAGSSISQVLTGLIPGTSYTVTFSAAQRARTNINGQTWQVQLDGTAIGSYAPPESAIFYTDYTASFTATATSQTLAFVGTDTHGGDNTVFIDNVRCSQSITIQDSGFESPSVSGYSYGVTGSPWTFSAQSGNSGAGIAGNGSSFFTNVGFSDSISTTLPNGNVLVAPVSPSTSGGTMIYNITSNTWSNGPQLFRGSYQDEASWVKLPDQSILTIDPFGTNSERYIPSLNQWINDGIVPDSLYDTTLGELGAAILLPNGKAFFQGSTGHTAIYTPSGNNNPGTWVAGPDFPNGLGTPDAPSAMMTSGVVLCTAGPAASFSGPTTFLEYDPNANSFTQVSGPTGLTDGSSAPFGTRLLDLPDGSVLYSDGRSQLYTYRPSGAPLAAGKPTISSISQNVDGSYHLVGTLLTGISEGAAYGDDAQMASNYPIVRITDSSGNVYFGRTYNWSSTVVMAGSTPQTTEFTVPNLPSGTYSLQVVTNGISSNAIPFSPIPSLIQDNGFESPSVSGGFVYGITGTPWMFSAKSGTNGSGITGNGSAFTSSNSNAPEGVQAAFLQGTGSFSQALTGLVPGANYTLTFSAAQRATTNINGQTWEVTLDGAAIGSYAPPQSSTNYNIYTASFTATTTSQTLAFVGTDTGGGDNTVFIDNVRLSPPMLSQDNGFESPSVAGGFTYGITGTPWTFSAKSGNNGSGIAGNGSAFTSSNSNAPEGVQVAFLQGTGSSISQALTGLVSGANYTVTFSAAQRATTNINGQTWQVQLDGNVIGSYAPPQSATAYIDYTASFTATATSQTLAFVGTDTRGGDNTIFIDNVRNTRVVSSTPVFGNGPPPSAATINTAYNFSYQATGLPAPTFTLISGNLPPGLTLTSGGVLSGMPTTVGTYTGTITASNGVGSPATQNFSITVVTAFVQWESLYFNAQQLSDPAISGAAAIPQHDGVPNLLKYLFNINPSVPMSALDRAALPVTGMATNGGNQYLTLTYRQYASERGLTVNVQTSSDLQSWQTVTPDITQQLGLDPNTGDPIIQVEVNTAGAPKKFIRLNVTGS